MLAWFILANREYGSDEITNDQITKCNPIILLKPSNHSMVAKYLDSSRPEQKFESPTQRTE